MAAPTRKYNPGFLSDEEIIASFCVRTNEFASLVEMLREYTGNANPHQLVIGPRGSGKTSLLRRVAAEIGRDNTLSASFFPIVFAEESYEVSTAGEFWLECLSRLAVQAPHREGSPDLHRTYDELRAIDDDQTLENRCLGALLDFADREGKRLVLMVENLNMMFGDMVDQDAGWRLRKVLQTEPRIVLLASATNRFDQIDNPDQALYDQFRVRLLRPLDTQECAVLWKTVSGHDARSETIRSLQILTGGDPRLVVIVARFGVGRSFRNLMANLLDLVDDHTEYFRGHIELLPAQERRVYLALAELWKPATTKEIADRSRLKPSPCSAQLTRLVERGIVEVAGGTARRKQYYLTQRLYNIYYLLRRPRGPDRLVEALIRFMEAFYAPPELRDIGVEMAREAGNFNGEMRTLHQTALAQLLALPALAEHRDTLLSEVRAQGLIPPGGAESEWTGVKPTPYPVDRRHRNADVSAEMTGRELIERGETFHKLKQPEDALAAYDEVVRRYGTSEVPALREVVARALHRMGALLWELERSEDALAACDEVVRRYGASEVPMFREAVALALCRKGDLLGNLERPEEALDTFDEVVRRLGEYAIPPDQGFIEYALIGKASFELECRNYDTAIRTAGLALEQCSAESLGSRAAGHLIRARATLENGDPSGCEQDIETLLALLPELDSLPRELLVALMAFSIELGPTRIHELIQDSPAAPLLLPLTTALEQELGLEPRVAREVDEVAQDIRKELEN
ncbi:MAG: AAA family ATPase, partial [Desulfurellaceae bacterium]|nr:AAA family ATPase [Desulfurellaceae bacterium]